jgi:glycosyltransferase involved in cell wall biosynthesis
VAKPRGDCSSSKYIEWYRKKENKDDTMKIAQIAPPWLTIPPKSYGGTEGVLFTLIEEQVAQGHDVTLFAPGDAKTSARLVSFLPRALVQDGVPWKMHFKAFYHLHKSLEEIGKQDFDIVHTHLSASADLYLFPLTAALALPHVTTLHSHFPFDRSGDTSGSADPYYMDWAAQVPLVALSESARQQEKFPLHFVGVVPNGVDMQVYRVPHRKTGDYFAWLGRFTPEKGAHLAIEAAKKADVPLILAGTIERSSRESMSYFHDVIEPQLASTKIKYIGPVNMRQKRSLLTRAHGFLNPIEWEEPFGMVMIEAMASGCPVISFARGAAPEIVVHGKTGFLVQNVEEMVQYIPKIDEIDREETYEHVERHFSARIMAEKYLHVYQEVIAMYEDRATQKQIHFLKQGESAREKPCPQ